MKYAGVGIITLILLGALVAGTVFFLFLIVTLLSAPFGVYLF